MNRLFRIVLIVVAVGFGFLLGMLATAYQDRLADFYQPQVVKVSGTRNIMVGPDTPIVFEQAFARCKHILTAEYGQREELVNKNLDEIRQLLPNSEGYLVWFNEDGTLVIHQRLEDWCPADLNRVHLGVFKDHVAVFRGPQGVDDEVIRVTCIPIKTLPEKLRHDIVAGLLEFEHEEQANYVLENLDEYE